MQLGAFAASFRRLVIGAVAFSALAACGAPSALADPHRIARVWHGRVPTPKADDYEAYLVGSVQGFKSIKGNLGFEVFRDTVGAETDFMVVSYWVSLDAIHAFAGTDIRKVHALARDPEFLIEPEALVHNYAVVDQQRSGHASKPGSTRSDPDDSRIGQD